MNSYTGVVRFSPLEGGFWQLVAEDGTTYHLVGNLKNLKDGKRVSVEGQIEKKRLSFAMTGPILRAEKVVLLP
jgi:hypothetical protein